MQEDSGVYVGLDTSKPKIAVALAAAGRDGGVRSLGETDGAPEAVERLPGPRAGRAAPAAVLRLRGRPVRLRAAAPDRRARPRLRRGRACAVVAPSLVPERPGERVETNRRDAPTLARPRRAGELTPVRVPDPGHEAMREPARAREAAMEDLRAKRQHLQSFLLRHGRVFAVYRTRIPGQ